MNHSELFAALKKGELARCYLLEGEEEFIKRYYIRRLGSWLSFDRAFNVKEMFADWLSSPYEE